MTEAEEIRKRVAELMNSGRYPSSEALMLEALKALEVRDFWEDEYLQKALAVSLADADADAGRLKPLGEVFDALEARMRRG